MGGLSRYDFFRIVVPGALVTALAYLVAAIVKAADGPGPSWADQTVSYLDNTTQAFVIAFAAGLFLYIIDPGYASPSFWASMPSSHLRERLRERGHDDETVRQHLSIYFLASDSMLPDDLKERAVLYGALYRVFFQVALFGGLSAAAAASLSFYEVSPEISEFDASPLAWAGAGINIALCAVPLLKPLAQKRRRRHARPRLWWVCAALIAGAAFTWTWVSGTLPEALPASFRDDNLAMFGSVGAIAVGWTVLRMTGPVKNRWRHLRDGGDKPSTSWSTGAVVLQNAMLVMATSIPLLLASGEVSDLSVGATNALLAVPLTSDWLRKHDRQLNGIYRNQNLWIDSSIVEIERQIVVPLHATLARSKVAGPTDGRASLSAFCSARAVKIEATTTVGDGTSARPTPSRGRLWVSVLLEVRGRDRSRPTQGE